MGERLEVDWNVSILKSKIKVAVEIGEKIILPYRHWRRLPTPFIENHKQGGGNLV